MFLHRYSSILHLCVSQFEFVLGKAVPKMDMNQVNPPLAFLYSILYISFMTVIIVNLFIAILNCSLEEIKDNQESVSDKLDLADFIVGYFTPVGVLPYMGYMGMCRCEGYGFQAVYSRIGYTNQRVWV